jgi:hypothetical protein
VVNIIEVSWKPQNIILTTIERTQEDKEQNDRAEHSEWKEIKPNYYEIQDVHTETLK